MAAPETIDDILTDYVCVVGSDDGSDIKTGTIYS
jgi:hypothetical protein